MVDERERGKLGGKCPWKSADGIYIHHTIYARMYVKRLQQKRATNFAREGKKLNNAATKCSKILDDSNGRVVALY